MGQKLVRFDWAMKTLLRDKANFDVLEGFLGALLKDDNIQIISILESESNAEEETDKFNRVDLLVEDGNKRKIIIEIQNTRESDYLERILYGTSKVIVENQKLGEDFKDVTKVISVSILYFNLGLGQDYLYYGTTEIRGVHTHKPLIVKRRIEVQKGTETHFQFVEKKIFPEYYLITVERYQNVIQSNIDEWIYLIKNSEIKSGFSAKNIDKAEQKLVELNMTDEQRENYKRYMINVARERDILRTAKEEGWVEGQKAGKEEGKMEGKLETQKNIALMMLNLGETDEKIVAYTGLTIKEIEILRVDKRD